LIRPWNLPLLRTSSISFLSLYRGKVAELTAAMFGTMRKADCSCRNAGLRIPL
jgi:hypothetical protein